MMLYLSQRDPKWVSVLIGASQLTVGRWGCLVTCLAMISSYFNCYMTPAQIAAQKPWFTLGGLVNWLALNFARMKFLWRYYKRDDAVIREALRNPDKAVLLQVASGSHWVVALQTYGTSYIVLDPWFGDKCDVIKRYGNISGMAVFARK